jgi:Family of unknown function (DUF6326)
MSLMIHTVPQTTSQANAERRALRDQRPDVKVVLAGLWTAMLFVFAYVDIFTFWRADVNAGVRQGKVPGTGFAINQTFLVATTCYVAVACLMIIASLLAAARLNRIVNAVVSVLYIGTIVASCIGESWRYYLLGSAIEVLLLLVILRRALTWPAAVSTIAQDRSRQDVA